MVWRSIAFSDAKQLLVGCREQIGIKDTEFELKVVQSFKAAKWNLKKLIVVLKCKKNVSFWENWQKWTLTPSLSEVPKIFVCVRVRQVTFLSEDWKSCLSEAVSSLWFPL